MNYYPFHIGDYASATRHLSWDEDSAFRRLLDVYYTTEKPLPLEIKACWRLVLAQTESQREAVESVLNEFFAKTAEGWVNGRADAEIAAMREKQEQQRIKANKRWQKQRTERGNAAAMPEHLEGCATASENYADAMPPTPTPTPTPVIKNKTVAVRPVDVDEQVWADFLAIRKAKKSPLTETALAGIEREALKAGLSLAKTLEVCCSRGWQGFEAAWLQPKQTAPPVRMPKPENFALVDYGTSGPM